MEQKQVEIVATADNPICPYCENEMEKIEVKGNQPAVLICPHCKKFLQLGLG